MNTMRETSVGADICGCGATDGTTYRRPVKVSWAVERHEFYRESSVWPPNVSTCVGVCMCQVVGVAAQCLASLRAMSNARQMASAVWLHCATTIPTC